MEIKELKYFRTIAECGSFSKAAAHLRVAQPALGRQVRKLEHDLGVSLFKRTSRGVTPTTAGQLLLERTIHFEQEIDEAKRAVRRVAEQASGVLRVGVQFPLSVFMAPDLVAIFRKTFPDVTLQLTEGVSADLVDGMLEGQLDVALVDTPSHPSADLVSSPLWVETLNLVGPPGKMSELGDGSVKLCQVADLPIIMANRRYSVRRLVDAAFERHHLKFNPSIEANGSSMILELVKAGYGYSLMPSSVYHPWVARGELCALDVEPPILRTMSLIVRKALLSERPAATFKDMVSAITPRIVQNKTFGAVGLY